MTFTKLLAATALCAVVSTPLVAQEIPYGANGRTGQHTQYTGNHGGYRGGYGYNRGYGPGAFVAGAIGTAAAIATSPLYGDSYAYEPAPVYQQRNTYGGNGFVCEPGTTYINGNGYAQYCQ